MPAVTSSVTFCNRTRADPDSTRIRTRIVPAVDPRAAVSIVARAAEFATAGIHVTVSAAWTDSLLDPPNQTTGRAPTLTPPGPPITTVPPGPTSASPPAIN